MSTSKKGSKEFSCKLPWQVCAQHKFGFFFERKTSLVTFYKQTKAKRKTANKQKCNIKWCTGQKGYFSFISCTHHSIKESGNMGKTFTA